MMQNCTGLQDKSTAVGWLTKAAAAGNVLAEVQLAHANRLGLGLPQDDAKAFALYSQAAATANPVAQMELAASVVSPTFAKAPWWAYWITIWRQPKLRRPTWELRV